MSGDWLTLGAVAALAVAGARKRGSRNNDCDGPFFHTTTWDRLQSIAEDGLVPGYGSRFGGWYQGHSRGRIFVAQGGYEGVEWFNKIGSTVEHGAELREEDELPTVVPVMLRLDLEDLTLAQDQAAKMDRRDCAFYVTETIEPDRIWFYDGSSASWRPIDEWDESDPMAAVRQWNQEWDEDDEDVQPWIEFTLRESYDDDAGAFGVGSFDEAAAAQGWDTQRQGSAQRVAREQAVVGGLTVSPMRVRFVHPYVSPRERALTPAEAQVRRMAYALKDESQQAFAWGHMDRAGREMAAVIADLAEPVLVPVPDSRGDTRANRLLVDAIVKHHVTATVCDALGRSVPVQASHRRRKTGRSSISIQRHGMVARQGCTGTLVFVDNVVTTGNTLRAARRALGDGIGLVWAAAGPSRGSSNQVPTFVVRSEAQGAKLIAHPQITANHKKALRVKPKYKTAVLVPCAGTKPFPQSPSHKHGYLPALADQAVDVYVVSEPLGVVPYAWSEVYPNNAYDFPPTYLKGRAFDLLVERVGEWLDKVGPKYQRIVLALPSHHMKLVRRALVGRDLPVEEAGVVACKQAGVCADNVYRATHGGYSGWLGKQVKGSAMRWESKWWTGKYKKVRVDGEAGRIFKVGYRFALVFDKDLRAPDGFDPRFRWTFQVGNYKLRELRPTKAMEARYRRSFGEPSAHRYIPPADGPWEKLKRRVESDLQRALDAARRRRS